MYIFNLRRVLAHYNFSENSLTTSRDIINHSESFKENISSSLNSKILGRIISDLWKGEVQPVRRGPRNHQQHGYLNLSRKCESNVATCSPEGTHAAYQFGITCWVEVRSIRQQFGVTSGQKPCTKTINIVLQTSVGLF